MSLRSYLRTLRKRWLWVAGAVLLGVLIAVNVSVFTHKVYASQATSYVSVTSDGTDPASLYQSSQFALKQMTSYTQLINSPSVLEPTARELKLAMTPAELGQHVTATSPPDTALIDVRATAPSAALAQGIANAAAKYLGTTIEAIETPRSGGASPVRVTVAVPAKLSAAPISPRTKLNVVLGLLIGLAVGIAVAILRDQFDTSIKTTEELQELTGLAPLGAVNVEPGAADQPLVILDRNHRSVEAFRSIRTSLQFANVDKPPRHLVITSPSAEDGKTLVACNLAIAMAQDDTRVCLLDADLRRPKAARYFGLPVGAGLTDVVAGRHKLDDALVPWHRGQVMVLQAGTNPPDPGQLLGSDAMITLLETLRSRFDVVIIDAPPLLPVSDAAILSHRSDGAILVVRHGQTRREQLNRATSELGKVGATLIGTVLNRVPVKNLSDRYGAGVEYTTAPDRRSPDDYLESAGLETAAALR